MHCYLHVGEGYLQPWVCIEVSHLAGAIVPVVIPMHCHKSALLLLWLMLLILQWHQMAWAALPLSMCRCRRMLSTMLV